MAEKFKSLGTDEDVYQFLEVWADGEATLLAVFILRLPRNKAVLECLEQCWSLPVHQGESCSGDWNEATWEGKPGLFSFPCSWTPPHTNAHGHTHCLRGLLWSKINAAWLPPLGRARQNSGILCQRWWSAWFSVTSLALKSFCWRVMKRPSLSC